MPPKTTKEKKVKNDNIKLEKINDTKCKIPNNNEWIKHTKLFTKYNNIKYTEAIKRDENRIVYHNKKIITNIDNKKFNKRF